MRGVRWDFKKGLAGAEKLQAVIWIRRYNCRMKRVWWIAKVVLMNLLAVGFLLLVAERSTLLPADPEERIRVYTRDQEFDYVEWMLAALNLKVQQAGLAPARYLDEAEQKKLVYDYLDLVASTDRLSYQIAKIYADPRVQDAKRASADLRKQRNQGLARQQQWGPLAEQVIQGQVAQMLAGSGLTLLGQPIPAVLYHVTPLPYALIVSPRDHIEQEENISLVPGLTLEERVKIEDQVAKNLDKSALVVGIGGVGVYPTMVMSTADLNWLTDTVAHEWTHNYLILRPLGLSYEDSPELRTINETTASIVGGEVGRMVMARYYPERLPPEEKPAEPNKPQPTPDPNAFSFNKEMRTTRLKVDDLLKQGQLDEAEAYMEQRRAFFWDNGYLIRKLNQAYFAFYGAYNDQPGGAGSAGRDPVGPAVQALRQQSSSLADFLNRISWISSFGELQKMVGLDPIH